MDRQRPNWKREADLLELEAFELLALPIIGCSPDFAIKIGAARKQLANDLMARVQTFYVNRWRRRGWAAEPHACG